MVGNASFPKFNCYVLNRRFKFFYTYLAIASYQVNFFSNPLLHFFLFPNFKNSKKHTLFPPFVQKHSFYISSAKNFFNWPIRITQVFSKGWFSKTSFIYFSKTWNITFPSFSTHFPKLNVSEIPPHLYYFRKRYSNFIFHNEKKERKGKKNQKHDFHFFF